MVKKPHRAIEHARSLEIELARLEIASGYDGLFRGAPEPVIVVAAYALEPTTATTALRGVFRVQVHSERYPLTASASGVGVVPRSRSLPRGADVLLVAVGVEDDGGDGVSHVYGALERATEIALATVDNGADTKTLAEIGSDADAWKTARRARVIVDGLPLEARVLKDDFVGAAAVRFSKSERAQEHRLHVAGDDFVNDWTAIVLTRFGH